MDNTPDRITEKQETGGSFFPAWTSPLLVLNLRQMGHSRSMGWSLLVAIGLLYMFIQSGDGDLGGRVWFFILCYTCIIQQILIVIRFHKVCPSSQMESLMLTSLGSFRIMKGIWLCRMVVPVCLWSFLMGMGGMFYLFGNVPLVELYLGACAVLISGALTALSLWAATRNLFVRVIYILALLCFSPWFFFYADMASSRSAMKRAFEGTTGGMDFYYGVFPLTCLLILLAYVFLAMAAGELSRQGAVERLAFRKAMVGLLAVPAIFIFYNVFSLKLSEGLFDVFFFASSFFLCFCFIGDALKKGASLPAHSEKSSRGALRWLRFFLRPGWESGALLFLFLTFVSGCLFDVAAFSFYAKPGKSLITGYGVYSLLLAGNVLLFVMGGQGTKEWWRSTWIFLWLLPVGLIFMVKAEGGLILSALVKSEWGDAIPLLNLVNYKFGVGVSHANALFILTAVLIYGVKTRRYWQGKVSDVNKDGPLL